MRGKAKFIPVVLGGLVTTGIMVVVVVFVLRAWWSTPFQVLGMGEPPEQPIAFPHTQHVDVDGINCAFCHRNVLEGEPATIPAVEQCMFCHATIQGDKAPAEVAKVVAHFESNEPINWKRVHHLPDHVQFSHEPHIRYLTKVQGLSIEGACSTCHGEVREMVEVEQVRRLKMGDCVDCHRNNVQFSDNKDITDCATCHY
ncbi:hypothetical protein FIM12_06345 [SAR202 cluster bacterium AD-804-J14_MRT_500m]|nr:hypothetical protein [SAR202 cluster bacterium AD-804-J14_MRT_500m]